MLLRQKHFLPREPAEQQFLLKSSRAFARGLLPSLKLDVGGGFLGCLWKFNEIKSKTVRAFA
jgi:hypothetical protein